MEKDFDHTWEGDYQETAKNAAVSAAKLLAAYLDAKAEDGFDYCCLRDDLADFLEDHK